VGIYTRRVSLIPAPFEEALALHVDGRSTLLAHGVTTAYWSYGPAQASTVIYFVHGFRGDHHGLESFASELGDEYRCIIPDLPGFGESTDFVDTASIANYAAWLTDFIERTRANRRVILVGHSFGSIVVAAALSQGLRVDSRVLINPIAKNALAGPRGIMTRLAVFYYWLSSVLPERVGFALLRSSVIVRVMSNTMAKTQDPDLRAWIHDQHDHYFSHFGSRKAVLQAFRASVSSDVSSYANALHDPILLLVGDRDDITDIETQMRFADSLPSATIVVAAGVGHLVHYEAYQWASDEIRRYITKGVM